MLTCKQVSRALNEADYMKLSAFRRFLLKLHVGTCVICGRYNKQVMQFHDIIRALLAREDAPAEQPGMPPDVRNRLEQYVGQLAAPDHTETSTTK